MDKVLFITHQLAFNSYGGAETQILKTMSNINSLNNKYQVKLFDIYCDSIEDYEIIHIFNPGCFPFESYVLSEYAKSNNIKVITSSIYFSEPPQKNVGSIAFDVAKNIFFSCRKYFLTIGPFSYFDPLRFMGKLFQNSNLILPNTYEEYQLLNKHFSIPYEKCRIVPNGVDLDFKYGDSCLFKDKYGFKDYILFVGRIDKRKNVLRLIKAFAKSGIDTNLVIIGKIADPDYYSLCKKHANRNVIFFPPIPHESELLKSVYKGAKVTVLPSEYETPGLVALEGGLAGSNVVVTKVGGTKEYFGKYAFYVDPHNEKSIMEAIVNAYNTPLNNNLSNYIESKFTWKKVAERTIEAYEIVMGNKTKN